MNIRSWKAIAIAAATLLAPRWAAGATNFDSEFAGTNDFGEVGLLQTPTARMRADGTLGFGFDTDRPYNQAHFFLQNLPWLDTVLRYSDVLDKSYNAAALYGNNQHYKDKSADLKVRLLQEGPYWPELALGIQDIGGTGLFSSEYLVGSYHYYDLDFSAGLAWGRLGSGGHIPNPFRVLGHHFDRPRGSGGGEAGQVGTDVWFTGKTIGPFGGIAWNTPLKGLRAVVEWDGNDYQHEAFANLVQHTHVNAGFDYEILHGVEFGMGWERGKMLSAHLDLSLNLNHFAGTAKTSDQPPEPLINPPPPPAAQAAPGPSAAQASTAAFPAIAPFAAAPPAAPPPAAVAAPTPAPLTVPMVTEDAKKAFALGLKARLNAQGYDFAGLSVVPEAREAVVWISQYRYRSQGKALGRVARVLCNTAPPQLERFTVVNLQQGVETYRFSFRRDDFARAAAGEVDLDALLAGAVISGPSSDGLNQAQVVDDTRFPRFSWDTAPALRQNVGGPDEFDATQVWERFDGGVRLTDHWRLDGTIGINIWNDFDKLQQPSNSVLPHVRSDIEEYLKGGPNNLVKLETNYIFSPFDDVYARGSAGIFEEMYAGVAGQVLYRPFGQPWAIGVDGNWLRQRGFNQRFSFLDYSVVTGFVTLYYQLPIYNVLAQLTAGRYLARDKGATLDLSRRFGNGVVCGVFATKTNVSSARFGEGSFDKGVYISIPLDLVFTSSSQTESTLVFRPLTRDGGQRARDGIDLYDVTSGSSPQDIIEHPHDFLH